MPFPIAIILTLILAMLCGALNAAIITIFRVVPFVVTLATQSIQLYSVKEALTKDEKATLGKLAEIGYKNIELNAPPFVDGKPAPKHPAAEIRQLLNDLGMRALSIAMPANFHPDIEDWYRLTDYSNQIGCGSICCSVATFQNHAAVRKQAALFNKIGKCAAENGQQFYYHNHYQEFQRFDDVFVLETLQKNTNPAYMGFELDTFWVLRGGEDPFEIMDMLGDRFALIHVKDMNAGIEPVNLFEVIPANEVLDWNGFSKYSRNPAAFTELGEGFIDIRSLVEKSRRMPSVAYVVVEQDCTTIGELESAQMNYSYMKHLMQQMDKA